MAPLCPNLSNKKVKQAFDEMKEIFGEDMAYFLWSENGGYPLDLAPNGASSILFKSLMDHYSDRKQALISKAKVYSSNFKDWFGDWTKEDKTDVSKVVDENGEPLVVYHGTQTKFTEFSKKKEVFIQVLLVLNQLFLLLLINLTAENMLNQRIL